MTITREHIEIYRKEDDHPLHQEVCGLALIGLAVRDKESGLVESIRIAMWRARGERVGDLRESRSEIDAALSAITAYRSE